MSSLAFAANADVTEATPAPESQMAVPTASPERMLILSFETGGLKLAVLPLFSSRQSLHLNRIDFGVVCC